MKRKILPVFLALCAFGGRFLFAEEPKIMVDGAPLRYAFVEGDANKFREQNWIREGYAGGIQEFSLEQKNLPQDLSVSMEGHAIVEDNDYEAHVLVEKKNLGFTKFEYQEFSKFFDDTGGVYAPFTSLRVNSLGRDLELAIGHLRVEAGLVREGLPKISAAYERRFKDGAKSRLSWTPVREGAVTREIGPSFQEIREVVDSVEIKAEHTLKGIEIKNEERWEWVDTELSREEKNLATTGVAADGKIRVQTQNPKSKLFSTTTALQKWFREDRFFSGGAYHFLHMSNSEIENIFEMNKDRAIFNFANPKQIRNARADNEYDAHTWVGSLMFVPWKPFSVTTNVRTEVMDRSGNSSYPQDTTLGTPDGIINNTEISRTEDRVGQVGESLSLRYTGIPHTALYNEFEFEQVRNWLSEDRHSLAGQSASNGNEAFGRETITHTSRGIWTIGGQFLPCRFADLFAHFRIHRNNNDFDDKRETQPGASTSKSAFFDALNIQTEEFTTHLALKPFPWLRPSVRYQFQMRDYMARVEDLESVTTEMDSHIFNFDVSLQPRKNWLIVSGVSPQYAWVETPARFFGTGGAPRFQANIWTWFFNMSCNLNESVSLTNNFEFATADNFNDHTEGGLPLGAAYHQLNLSSSINWSITKHIGLQLEYSFYRYAADERVSSGDYYANLIALKTKVDWA